MIAEKLLGEDLRRGRDRDRRRADQGRAAAAAVRAPLPRCQSSRTPPMPAGPSRSPPNSSGTRSATPYLREESDELHERWAIPAPGEPLFEASAAQLLAALAGEGRHQQPEPRPAAADHGRAGSHRAEAVAKSTVKQYRRSGAVTDLEEFDRGHSLTIDSGWREVADACLAWLGQQGL